MRMRESISVCGLRCMYQRQGGETQGPGAAGLWRPGQRPDGIWAGITLSRGTPVRVIAAAVMIALCAIMGRAAAQPADGKAAAEQLFAQGRALMAQGDHAAACPKLEASLALDPALGTRLNLAHCYQQLGRLASAWARFREAADLAARAGESRREQFARERAAALEPRLPRLVIQVPSAAQVPGLTVKRDDAVVDLVLLGTPMYVDPGEHEVTAEAPGHAPFLVTVIAEEGREVSIGIPVLEPEPSAPDSEAGDAEPADRAPAREIAPAPAMEPETAPGATLRADSAPGSGRTRRVVGLAAGGAGVAALAAGLGVGWMARSSWEGAFASGACNRDTLVCTPAGQEQTDSARGRATLSNVLVGAGVALAATGAVLYLTAPDGAQAERAAHLVPTAGPDGLGMVLVGGF